jgi:hypothetical protein
VDEKNRRRIDAIGSDLPALALAISIADVLSQFGFDDAWLDVFE